MTTPIETDPTTHCETILRKGKASRIEKSILPSEVEIIDRLLARRLEMKDAYVELYEKLSRRPSALEVFFDCLVSTTAFWNPDANVAARAAREELVDINCQIATLAKRLANLLDRRETLHNTTGFYSETHYHPIDLVEQASVGNYLYEAYVKEKLSALRGQFDLKYWPSNSDCLRVLAHDAEHAEVNAGDPLTEAGTKSTRQGLSDYLRSLFASLDENGVHDRGFLPFRMRLSDATLASLTNVALDLSQEKMIGAEFVKHLRQRDRKRTAIAD